MKRYNFLIIFIGSFTWALTMFKSGIVYDFGMGFWGPNGHDGVWHLSLARSLSQGSLKMPIYSGADVTNYHLGFDILLAFLHKITFVNLSILYFQVLPLIFAILIGFLVYKLLKILRYEDKSIFWSLFFVYFSGNFGWLVSFMRTGQLAGESMFWAQPSILTLINPPFALSLIFILSGLIFLEKYKKSPATNYFLLATASFGLLIQIKAYAAVIALGSLFLTAIYNLYFKKSYFYLKIFLASLALNLAIFLPFNKGASSLLEFKPFWFLETMMAFPDRVGWTKFGEAMLNYKLAVNYIKLIPAYIVAFLIFWYGNLGTRFLAEIYALKLKNYKKIGNIDLFLVSSILIGLAASMLFVQKGTAWNTIQFFYYSLFFSSILAGIVYGGILKQFKKPYLSKVLIIGLLFFNMPTTFSVLKHYLPSTPPAMVSNEELKALGFLEGQEDGIVLVAPFEKDLGQYYPAPRPLYLYESTSYVSAFTGKQVFLEDEVNLDITGFDWQARREEVVEFFSNPNMQFLLDNNIKYIYVPNIYEYVINFDVIYESEEINVYKV